MDRQAIERRDFPIARRGYEIEAVDAHLATLADEYEGLARRGRADGPGGIGAAAGEQVRMIVEAAEQSAEDIAREAELEVRRLRQDAREEAERLRAEAGRQAREHVARVAEVASGLLDRVEGMDRELNSLLESVRGGGRRLAADLSLLQASVEEIRATTEAPAPAPTSADEADVPVRFEPDPTDPDADGLPGSSAAFASVLPAPPDSGAEPAADDDRPRSGSEGARMVALNMALNGVPRAETRDHLEQNFAVDGVDELLDEVYDRDAG